MYNIIENIGFIVCNELFGNVFFLFELFIFISSLLFSGGWSRGGGI